MIADIQEVLCISNRHIETNPEGKSLRFHKTQHLHLDVHFCHNEQQNASTLQAQRKVPELQIKFQENFQIDWVETVTKNESYDDTTQYIPLCLHWSLHGPNWKHTTWCQLLLLESLQLLGYLQTNHAAMEKAQLCEQTGQRTEQFPKWQNIRL